MSVGIPGTGIGGLFYLISGLLIPATEILAGARKKKRRAKAWRLVVRQTFLVMGILAGIWITGWLLGLLISRPAGASDGLDRTAPVAGTGPLWGAAAVLVGLAMLGLVLSAVETARFVFGRNRPSIPCHPSPDSATTGSGDAV
jgi:hypothetical protein